MCEVKRCNRHEFDHGLCLPHLKKKRAKEAKAASKKPVQYKPALETRED